MEDEEYRDDKVMPPLPPGWTIVHEEGTAVFTMTRQWRRTGTLGLDALHSTSAATPPSASGGGESQQLTSSSSGTVAPQASALYETHFVRAVLQTRDTSLDPEMDLRGEHFPFNIFISCPGLSANCVDVACDVIEGELRFDSVQTYSSELLGKDLSLAAAFDRAALYPGPSLDETEEEVLDGLQAYMAERGFDDQFGEFVAQYTCWIEQLEYERWLANLKAFVES
jgi:hypothetical protein